MKYYLDDSPYHSCSEYSIARDVGAVISSAGIVECESPATFGTLSVLSIPFEALRAGLRNGSNLFTHIFIACLCLGAYLLIRTV